MHPSAMRHGCLFFETYLPKGGRVVDIGAFDVNGSLRSVALPGTDYIGVDFAEGRGVDIVITDPYVVPIESASVDAVVSSSCFEHSEFFWLTFLESLRLLRPDGLLYLNAPSNGAFHRHPVDCWRFYPDSGVALQNWARRNDMNVEMLESFVGMQDGGSFNDFVAVFIKDSSHSADYPNRMKDEITHINGRVAGSEEFTNFDVCPEDGWKKTCLRRLFA